MYNKQLKLYNWKLWQYNKTIVYIIYLSSIVNEKFYLCLFLIKILSSQFFEQLWTVNEQFYATFWETCIINEFLKDNQEWMICFIETSHWITEQTLWSMFVSVLQYDDMIESTQLWNQFALNICSDLSHQIKQQTDNVLIDLKNAHWNFGLHLIAQNFVRYKWILNNFNMSGSVLF